MRYNFKRKILQGIALALLCISLSSCTVGRFVIYNFADIKDYKKFPSRPLESSDTPFLFYRSSEKPKAPKSITQADGKEFPFGEFLKKNKTVAFLIIQNDTLQYEQYFNGYDRNSIVPSFSMAKSITSFLIGCAIDDGLIHSIDDPVSRYIPELKKNGFDRVSIKELLQMTSGLHFSESYFSPFSEVASFYYGRNLEKGVLKFKLDNPPGEQFSYKSGNTEILGLILKRVLNGKSVTAYLQQKLWTPLHMEYDASWSLDRKDGLEKTFCCVNARAIDFAKIGRLYLDEGNWNGKQLVSPDWIKNSVKVDTTNGSAWFYQYQWWLPTTNGDFYADGFLGQYIYVNPAKNLIIVRLGKNEGKVDWPEIFVSLSSIY